MSVIKRLLITPGEPAGIGPDITIMAAQQHWPDELIAIADPDLLHARAKQLNLPLKLMHWDGNQPATAHQAGTLKIYPMSLNTGVTAGTLNPANADYVMRTLEAAATLCLEHKADAIVTGPVHKGIINAAGVHFTGHTEFFAEQANVAHTVMLFVVNGMRVALVTTHLPLANVPAAITPEKLKTVITMLHASLKQLFHIAAPRILVCGLNPHAGESGYLGREEIETITPLLDELRSQGFHLDGPLPADTIFTPKYLQQADAILAMYHDQALPLVKYVGFGHAVNLTLGLPFIRTSVDHGTAIDMAGTGNADAGSLMAAIKLAVALA